MKSDIIKQIQELKKEKRAVIMAHYYAPQEAQQIADCVGDSFFLAKKAKETDADIIVFCGVGFMAESVKLLNPEKKVLMPDASADCPMAHMAQTERIKHLREKYDDLAVVCYINSTSELKCLSDVCVTSSNAIDVVRKLPNKNIFFIPDRNLGSFVQKHVPEKNIILNDGCCPVHAALSADTVKALKDQHENALVLTHPECEMQVLEISDFIGSTSEIIQYASESPEKEFIICTEDGVEYPLKRDNPDKKFYFPFGECRCKDMKLNTLDKIYDVLLNETNEVFTDLETSDGAKYPLDRMLELAKKNPALNSKTDVVIVGTGVGGLYCALNLPENKNIVIVTKKKCDESDSFLAQGGICVLTDDDDYDAYFEDTMRAGHYENKKESVEIMIRSSRDIINDLIGYGVDFEKENGALAYTKEGAHSRPRILFHEDETGKEITSKLLSEVKKRKNVTVIEDYTMVDIICNNGQACGIIGHNGKNEYSYITADYTVLATGGIGGLYDHSTNFPHLTADALAIAEKHGVALKNIDYIQIHPTTLYTRKKGRRFLISESVRGEGAILLNDKMERFVDELLPRDIVANAIYEQMKKDNKPYVWLSFAPIPKQELEDHFPNICAKCLEEGYDVTRECIPVVPAQHYFMGGIDVDKYSKTSMERLYAVGETACNGVHGKNRLASNSLLESLVFAKRAAHRIAETYSGIQDITVDINVSEYENYAERYKKTVLCAIEKEKKSHE